MGSLEERMSAIDKRITIDTKEEFVLVITHNGIKFGELLIGMSKCTFNLASAESEIELYTINPKTTDGKMQSIHYSA